MRSCLTEYSKAAKAWRVEREQLEKEVLTLRNERTRVFSLMIDY